MTVTYTGEVATCTGFGTFLKLLCRWRGSIYKLVWMDLTVYLLLYYLFNLTYRFILDAKGKTYFEGVVNYCSSNGKTIPISFVLGFYVTVVMTRWWNQYTTIPWPDSLAVFVSATVHGQDERGRLMRRTIMRYVCLCLTMSFTNISPRVKKRFPTLDNLVEAGLLLDNEKIILDHLNQNYPKASKLWIPIVWAASIVTRARKEGRIRDDFAVKTIIDELNQFRGKVGRLLQYDNISVPLVYTQVVTIAVYSYFALSLLGTQWVDNKVNTPGRILNVDLYFPIFSTLEFFFYMGWLKVAESLINPFGEDDDDFEVNWIIDRDLQVSYMIVDEMHHEHPQLIKDQYWDEVFPSELPYTIATENQKEGHPEPSTARVTIPFRQRSMTTTNVAPSAIQLDEMATDAEGGKFYEQQLNDDDTASGIHFIVNQGTKGRKDDRASPRTFFNSMVTLRQPSKRLSRVNSFASAVKSLLSREDSRVASMPLNNINAHIDVSNKLSNSASNLSLNKLVPSAGAKKIARDVIEEVDEQATVSMRHDTIRPTVMNIFSQEASSPSDPIDIPKIDQTDTKSTSASEQWAQNNRDNRLSKFAALHSAQTQDSLGSPTEPRERLDSDVGPSLSAAGSQTLLFDVDGGEEPNSDDFNRLRNIREQYRKRKYLQKLVARSISGQQVAGSGELITNEALLDDLIAQSLAQARESDQ